MNDWCFRDIYKGGLWEDDLDVCAHTAADYLYVSSIDIFELSAYWVGIFIKCFSRKIVVIIISFVCYN